MKLAVLGTEAGFIQLYPEPPEVVAVDPDDPLHGDDWLGLVVRQEEGAARLVGTALTAGHRVLLGGVPRGDPARWDEIAARAGDALTMSRPRRYDPHFARANGVIRDGTVGLPRTVEICWGFDCTGDAIVEATELIDVACFLLADGPAAIYAVACEVAGPPLLKINLRTGNGAIAVIEVAADTDDYPYRRDLHLLATDGEIVHRLGHDDLFWSEGQASVQDGATWYAELQTLELFDWLDGRNDGLAQGTAFGWNLAALRAVERSLATGEMVRVGEGGE